MSAQESRDSDSEEIGWQREAESIVKEFKSCLNQIMVSTKLPTTDSRIYFNLETKEGDKYCVELTASGFRICSDSFDVADECDVELKNIDDQSDEQNYDKNVFYETMNALLDKLSPLYRISFSNQLIDRLNDHQRRFSSGEA